ncbi:MAG: hypothetical protein KAR55_02655, partial [Thermoplasmatales archaeon]|nr:hypothetical protein [Thermoplasmatales archaeon]
ERYATVANPSASTLNIRARTVSKSGSSFSLGTVVDVCSESNIQADANVEFDSVNNRFLVVWEDARQGTSNYNIYGKLYDTNGNQIGGEKTISSASDSQTEPWIAFDPGNERYLIVWEEGETPNNGPFDIYAGLFDENVNIIGSAQKLADGSSNLDYNFPCAYFNDETDEYLVTWNDGDISSGDWRGNVWGHILDSSGSTVKDNFQISGGDYIRTDIVTYPMTDFDDPYLVTYDDGDTIYGKLVSADGNAGDTEVEFSVGSDADGDWANIDIYNGKVFVAWEDIREGYPPQYDFFPDVFGNIVDLVTESGLSVSYSVGSEKNQVLIAHVTSVKITKPSDDYWDEFNAIYNGDDIQFSILHGTSGNILIEDIEPGESISSVTATSIRLMATFTRTDSSYSPELDHWSVTWLENDPPDPPSNPNPENGATDVGIDADLSWTCSDPDGDPLTYDVYFGENSNPPLEATGITDTTYDPGPMDYGDTYYWKIVAHDDNGASTTGPIWHFTTWINTAPDPPSNPSPSNGASNVGVDVDLSWTCNDPDGDDLFYDVYFGTTSNPPLVATNLPQTTYDPGTIDFETTYYWKIVAEDEWGATTSGSIWSFTTGDNDPPNSPSNPSPKNGATNVDIHADLSWTCTDPNGDDLIFDIYFGESSDPPLVYVGYPYTTYDPGVLDFDTKYYWKIVAEDVYGETKAGPKWSFTTGDNDPPYTPSNPSPADGATEVPIDITLSWSGGDPNPGDTVLYDLYFGTTSNPPIWKRNIETTSYPVSGLTYNLKYYWKVIAIDSHGQQSEGPVWDFITADGGTNGPPGTPLIAGPVTVGVNQPTDYQIHAKDPEGEDVFYKINWGDETTGWLGPYPSGEDQTFTHTWTQVFRIHIITVSAKDTNNNICDIDGKLPIIVPRNVNPMPRILSRLIEKLQEHPLFLNFLKLIFHSPLFQRMLE